MFSNTLRALRSHGQKPYKSGSLSDLPPLECRSPDKKSDFINIQIDSDYISQLQGHCRSSKLMEVWSCLYGVLPPVNLAGYHENNKRLKLTSLSDAYCLYRGIQRGYNEFDAGENIYVYITRPKYIYRFETSMACTTKAEEIEDGVVMATFVRMEDGWQNFESGMICGNVLTWDLVPIEKKGRIWLPKDFKNRFKEKIW